MFEQIESKKFINRSHLGKSIDIEFDTYIENRGKEEVIGVSTPLHYFEAGVGEPLILIHGIGQSLYTFRKNFKELSEHFHVFAIDLLGHGFSGKPDISYTIEEFALSIEAFLNAQKITKAMFCAFGEGCIYALDFAIHNSNRVLDLVLISPLISPSSHQSRGVASPLGLAASKMRASLSSVRSALEHCYFDQTLVTEEVVSEYALPIIDREYKPIAKMCITNFIDDQVINGLSSLSSQILVITGTEDRITRGSDSDFLQLPIANGSVLSIRNCGFFVHEEKPEKLNKAIVQFYREVSASSQVQGDEND